MFMTIFPFSIFHDSREGLGWQIFPALKTSVEKHAFYWAVGRMDSNCVQNETISNEATKLEIIGEGFDLAIGASSQGLCNEM